MARSGKMKSKPLPKGRKGGSHTPPFPHHLTMREAARNVEGRRNLWTGSQLRHRAVNFVRAEDSRPDESDEPEPADVEVSKSLEPSQEEDMTEAYVTAEQDMTADATEVSVDPSESVAHAQPTNGVPQPSQKEDVVEADVTAEQEMTVDAPEISIDVPSESVPHAQPTNTVPQPLPTPGDSRGDTPDDSSEDEIVFSGRCNTKANRGQAQLNQMGSDFMPTPRYITEDESRRESDGEENTFIAAVNTLQTSDSAAAGRSPVAQSANMDTEDGDYMSLKPSSSKRTRRPPKEDESDPLEDYIANMDIDYADIIRSYKMKGGSDTPESDTPDMPRDMSLSPTRDMDALFENSPRSAGGNVLSDSEDKEYIEGETSRQERRATKQKFSMLENIPHDDSPKDIMQDPDAEVEDSDEELSESEAEEIDLDIDLDVLQSEAVEQSSKYFRKGASQWWPFQSISGAMEFDPLYDLDMLDFSKADLKMKNKSKKKQKKMALELGLSDSDLEEELEMAWQKDRGKKKARKVHREELRSQGLLARGARKPDLGVKYSDGMDLDDFKAETKRFLLSSKNSLSLPPMKKDKRKLVHEVAGILSLKSQSRGNGPSRFTVLNKTGRTANYTPKTIIQVEKIFSSGKFSRRVDRPWTQSATPNVAKGTRGRKDNSASYMDGDVVGATAPEIGAGNKGRAMLEKMGWSMGTALGATNNKGILQPVAHVVKNSRAGLG